MCFSFGSHFFSWDFVPDEGIWSRGASFDTMGLIFDTRHRVAKVFDIFGPLGGWGRGWRENEYLWFQTGRRPAWDRFFKCATFEYFPPTLVVSELSRWVPEMLEIMPPTRDSASERKRYLGLRPVLTGVEPGFQPFLDFWYAFHIRFCPHNP